jgi:hypothetical protein
MKLENLFGKGDENDLFEYVKLVSSKEYDGSKEK